MRLSSIDLNLLVAFDALVAERSVTRAAERMGIGQSAMSATLARLRRMFDDPLLVRQGRQMVTTPLAESLIEPLREAMATIERTVASRSRFDPATDPRTFSVVASDYVTLVFLRPLLASLATDAPNVRVQVRPVTPDYRDQLRTGRADVVIVPREVMGGPSELSSSPLFDDRYVCACARDHPDVGVRMTHAEFSAQPYLAYDADPLHSVAEQQLDAAGITRNVEVSIESFLLAPYLLAGTRLITLVHERLAVALQDHLDIQVLEPPVPLTITEVMAWSPRDEHDPGHRWLRTRLHDLATDL